MKFREKYEEETGNSALHCTVSSVYDHEYVAWLEEKLTSDDSQSTPCEGCTAIEECRPYWGVERPACYKD